MTINDKRKKLILSAGIIALIAIIAAVVKFTPEKSAPADKALLRKQGAGTAARQHTAADFKAAALGNTKNSGTVAPDAIDDEEAQEKKPQREEAYENDTPQKAEMRASLEKDIRALSEKKEKETRELSYMIKSIDDAISNSQLPPNEQAAKKTEIEVIKQALISTYNENLASIDSALQEKFKKYKEVTQK